MTSLQEQLDAGLAAQQSVMGVTISYTPPGGEAAGYSAIREDIYEEESTEVDGTIVTATGSWLIAKSDLTRPTCGATLTDDSRTYRVVRYEDAVANWRVVATRSVTSERSGENYRRQRGR